MHILYPLQAKAKSCSSDTHLLSKSIKYFNGDFYIHILISEAQVRSKTFCSLSLT